jgi:pimeloyl-ACP methyl ester carboxylesterase
MTAAALGDLTIEYEITGEGIPLLLVMGLGSQLIHWPDDFVAQLADRGFQVIRYDNRDMGLSSKTEGEIPGRGRTVASLVSKRLARSDYLLADMADDGAQLLDHLGISAAHVVGVSMGGMIAQSIAIAHPGKVLSLTSIMSNTGDRRNGRPTVGLLAKMTRLLDPSPESMMDNGVGIGRLISGPHFDEAQERLTIQRAFDRAHSPEGMIRQLLAISASPDRTPQLRTLDVPTLVVHGLVDPLVRPSGGIATARAIPGSRLLMFPDMGHDLPRNRWVEVIDAITTNAGRATAVAAAR